MSWKKTFNVKGSGLSILGVSTGHPVGRNRLTDASAPHRTCWTLAEPSRAIRSKPSRTTSVPPPLVARLSSAAVRADATLADERAAAACPPPCPAALGLVVCGGVPERSGEELLLLSPFCLRRFRASTWDITSRRRSGGSAPRTDLSIWEKVI